MFAYPVQGVIQGVTRGQDWDSAVERLAEIRRETQINKIDFTIIARLILIPAVFRFLASYVVWNQVPR
jgi:hypothetical protein